MKDDFDRMIDQFLKLDHPMVDKFKELKKGVSESLTVDESAEFLANWKKNNPEEAAAMREFLCNFQDEYKESRREVKSELGYSRIGRNNV
jgi:hypothetical protein